MVLSYFTFELPTEYFFQSLYCALSPRMLQWERFMN